MGSPARPSIYVNQLRRFISDNATSFDIPGVQNFLTLTLCDAVSRLHIHTLRRKAKVLDGVRRVLKEDPQRLRDVFSNKTEGEQRALDFGEPELFSGEDLADQLIKYARDSLSTLRETNAKHEARTDEVRRLQFEIEKLKKRASEFMGTTISQRRESLRPSTKDRSRESEGLSDANKRILALRNQNKSLQAELAALKRKQLSQPVGGVETFPELQQMRKEQDAALGQLYAQLQDDQDTAESGNEAGIYDTGQSQEQPHTHSDLEKTTDGETQAKPIGAQNQVQWAEEIQRKTSLENTTLQGFSAELDGLSKKTVDDATFQEEIDRSSVDIQDSNVAESAKAPPDLLEDTEGEGQSDPIVVEDLGDAQTQADMFADHAKQAVKLEADYDSLKEEIARISDHLDRSQLALQTAQARYSGLTQMLRDWHNKISHLMGWPISEMGNGDELTWLRECGDALERNIECLATMLASKSKEVRDRDADLTTKTTQLENAHEMLQKQNDLTAEMEKALAEHTTSEGNDELVDLRSKLEDMSEKMKRETARADNAEKTTAGLSERLQWYDSEQERLNETRGEIERLNKKLEEDHATTLRAHREEKKRLKGEFDELKQSLREVHADIRKYAGSPDIHMLDANVPPEGDSEMLRRTLPKLLSEATKVKEITLQLQAKEEDLALAKAEKVRLEERLKEQIQRANAIENRCAEIEKERSKIESGRNEQNELEKCITETKQELSALGEDHQALKRKVRGWHDQISVKVPQSTPMADADEATPKELDNAIRDLFSRFDELATSELEMRSEKKGLELQLSKSLSEIEQHKRHLNELRETMAGAAKSPYGTHQEQDARQDRYERFQAKLAAVRENSAQFESQAQKFSAAARTDSSELQKERERSMGTERTINRRIAEIQSENGRLQEEKSKIEGKCIKLQEELSSAKSYMEIEAARGSQMDILQRLIMQCQSQLAKNAASQKEDLKSVVDLQRKDLTEIAEWLKFNVWTGHREDPTLHEHNVEDLKAFYESVVGLFKEDVKANTDLFLTVLDWRNLIEKVWKELVESFEPHTELKRSKITLFAIRDFLGKVHDEKNKKQIENNMDKVELAFYRNQLRQYSNYMESVEPHSARYVGGSDVQEGTPPEAIELFESVEKTVRHKLDAWRQMSRQLAELAFDSQVQSILDAWDRKSIESLRKALVTHANASKHQAELNRKSLETMRNGIEAFVSSRLHSKVTTSDEKVDEARLIEKLNEAFTQVEQKVLYTKSLDEVRSELVESYLRGIPQIQEMLNKIATRSEVVEAGGACLCEQLKPVQEDLLSKLHGPEVSVLLHKMKLSVGKKQSFTDTLRVLSELLTILPRFIGVESNGDLSPCSMDEIPTNIMDNLRNAMNEQGLNESETNKVLDSCKTFPPVAAFSYILKNFVTSKFPDVGKAQPFDVAASISNGQPADHTIEIEGDGNRKVRGLLWPHALSHVRPPRNNPLVLLDRNQFIPLKKLVTKPDAALVMYNVWNRDATCTWAMPPMLKFRGCTLVKDKNNRKTFKVTWEDESHELIPGSTMKQWGQHVEDAMESAENRYGGTQSPKQPAAVV